MIKQILIEAYRNCVKRFLAPSIFAVLSALFMLYFIWREQHYNVTIFCNAVFLSLGGLFSLAYSLWKEEGIKSVRARILYAVVLVGIIADVLYLYSLGQPANYGGVEVGLAHLAVYLTLLVAIWILPFFRSEDDVPVWNFAQRLLKNLSICWIIGLILTGGIVLLLIAFQNLFGISVSEKILWSVFVLFAFLFPLLLFLSLIPSGKQKYDETLRGTGFLHKVVRYVFLPLEALYLLVLYTYAWNILLVWQLPNGMVSWPVIAAFVGCVGIEVLLYPSRKKYNNRFDNLVAQYLPLILLPLLLLMTVGIYKRISDYGISVARLYLILLNLWFYLVCLWLYFSRAKRFRFIPVTFVVLLLLSSVLPINFTSITRNSLERTIRGTLLDNGAEQLPLEFCQFDQLMCTMPKREACRVAEKIDYLRDIAGKSCLGEFVEIHAKDIDLSKYIIVDKTATDTSLIHSYKGFIYGHRIIIPSGSKEFSYAEIYTPSATAYEGKEILLPVSVENLVVDSVKVDIAQFRRLTDNFVDPLSLETTSPTRTFIVTGFEIISNTETDTYSFWLGGYLFSK